MKRKGVVLQLLEPVLRRMSTFIAYRLKNRFYIILALAFSIVAILDTAFFHITANMKQKTFDLMIRHRIITPAADRDIIIVDINEASLSAMAKEYGRWPWPRQVMGEFLEVIERQKPKAVVFDILFSDADVYNPDSDAYFNSAISETSNTFFPVLRLPEENDSSSEIKPSMLAWVKPISGETQQDRTIALVLPHFQAALDGGRLGIHNIYPDNDGIVRQYRLYRNDYGWQVPSLPLQVTRSLGLPVPTEREVLLNWRGQPFSYHYVSFSDVYEDFLRQEKRRPQDEFTDKIVIIGSTAPSLFDVKATSMAKLHPGVEILATALDNIKHRNYFRVPDSATPYLLLTLAIVWMTAMGFYHNLDLTKFDRVFGLSQIILVAISYASINFTSVYIDLTGPVTIGLACFSIARIYASATEKAMEADVVTGNLEEGGMRRGVLMLVRLTHGNEPADENLLRRLRLALKSVGTTPRNIDYLKGEQVGIWGLIEGTMVISWAYPLEDKILKAAISGDIDAISAALQPLVKKYGKNMPYTVTTVIQEGTLADGGPGMNNDAWKQLFTEGMRQLLKENET